MLWWVTLALAAGLISGWQSGPAEAAPAVTVVETGEGNVTVELHRSANGELTGTRQLVVHSNASVPGEVVARYLPRRAGDENALASTGKARSIPPGGFATITLVAALPSDSAPSELDGILDLTLASEGKSVGSPQTIAVEGKPPGFVGVTLVPEKLAIHTVNWAGPLDRLGSNSEHQSVAMELRGPGVPSLFRESAAFTTKTLLRSSTGHEIEAILSVTAPAGGATIARGQLTVTGKLRPGSYSGTLPLSDLSSAGPALAVTTETSDSFLWAFLMVGLGAVVGGGVYFASNLKRRRDLMRGYLRATLEDYESRRTALAQRIAGAEFPLWEVEDLGDPAHWFDGTWTPTPSIHGVQGIWCEIQWARSEADLNEAQTHVNAMLERLSLWLGVAAGEGVPLLVQASKMEPADPPEASWSNTQTSSDTARLLRVLREEEPSKEQTVNELSRRVKRQARWHSALALAWNAKSVVIKDVALHPAQYSEQDRNLLATIDVTTIDTEGAEKERDAEKQRELEIRVDKWVKQLITVYKGDDPASVVFVAGPAEALILAARTPDEVHAPEDPEVQLPEAVGGDPAGRAGNAADGAPGDAAAAGAPAVGVPAPPAAPVVPAAAQAAAPAVRQTPAKTPGWLTSLWVRDALWSILIVLVTLAAYVPALYGPTWGDLGDYFSAFAAGFFGKVAINWALLPLFASLSLRQPPKDAPTLPEIAKAA